MSHQNRSLENRCRSIGIPLLHSPFRVSTGRPGPSSARCRWRPGQCGAACTPTPRPSWSTSTHAHKVGFQLHGSISSYANSSSEVTLKLTLSPHDTQILSLENKATFFSSSKKKKHWISNSSLENVSTLHWATGRVHLSTHLVINRRNIYQIENPMDGMLSRGVNVRRSSEHTLRFVFDLRGTRCMKYIIINLIVMCCHQWLYIYIIIHIIYVHVHYSN